ncbi:hypothetical protein [Guptibacillus hwajinpoensis]|uniref:Uncharacterized protein n=1 Tax=Guptibacillus hwajinpoensis TaxID=208199 RepID=A0ABU0JVF2_9BACL|nr:hypothetical protein [Alkalihalobacillus hemicentroti]MDQ0481080.1 hypothetical protein [Alkalihalobacillus hemicentroti]
MLGYRRADLDLANELYSSQVKVEIQKVENEYVGRLMHALKELKQEVYSYYEGDQLLTEETDLFIKICRRVVVTLSNYSTYFKECDEMIVKYFTLTKRDIYAELFKEKVEPIIALLKILRKKQSNSYIETLQKLFTDKMSIEKTYILTKKKPLNDFVTINGMNYKIMLDKEFVNLGVFADAVIFLGTPNYFSRKFSEIFYGKHTMFLGYSCFESRLVKNKSFSDLVSHEYQISTKYKGVSLDKGYSGLNYRDTFLNIKENKSEEAVIKQIENINVLPEKKVEVKLATISNKNYVFLPILEEINLIDKYSLKISQAKVIDLSIGDLLVLRNQNGSNLIKEVANSILGTNAKRYRERTEKWKKKLRFNVNKKGIKTVSRILTDRYNISVATENNIKNWISTYSIKPSRLNELLTALKFNVKDKEEILEAAEETVSAHISAGHLISQALMKELDKNLESVIDENGFYTFESKEFEGASFNIEEIIDISNGTYFIPEDYVLKVIKE